MISGPVTSVKLIVAVFPVASNAPSIYNFIELASQLHDFSISIDDAMTAMFDSAMKFPREDERRTIEFSPEDFVDKVNKSKSRLDGSVTEDLKNIFLNIEKFKESNEEEDTNEE